MTAETKSYPIVDNSVLMSSTEPVIELHRWVVRPMQLSPEKVVALWHILEQYRTLFSDFTRGDFDNYLHLLAKPNTFFLEIYEGDRLVGIVYFSDMESIVDPSVHLVDLDKRPSEKTDIYREIVRYMFKAFPIQRITAPTPDIYFATKNLLKRLGFKQEGTKRAATLIGGRWVDVVQFGILRSEVT